MKKFFTLFLVCTSVMLLAQTKEVPQHIKTAFAGKWERSTKYYFTSLEILFEKGADYATIIDYGTGEAPPLTYKANIVGNKLVVLPDSVASDYLEMEVKNHRLYFRQPAEYNPKRKTYSPKSKELVTKIFRKVKR